MKRFAVILEAENEYELQCFLKAGKSARSAMYGQRGE